MKLLKLLLPQKDKEILRKHQINKEVQIKLFKLQANVKKIEAQKQLITLSQPFGVSNQEFASTADEESCATEQELFKCHLCPYLSAFKPNLKRHSWTHLADKRFKCDKCSFRTNYKNSLQCHTSLQHNKNPESRTRNYACQLCTKSFFAISTLRSHLSVHTKEKPFLCHFCSKTFTSNANKNRHEIMCIQNPKGNDSVWVESQKHFQCKLCSRKMFTSGELTVHIRYHTQEKPYKCDKCDHTAASASVLKGHVERRHNPNKIRNIACELCHKLFFTKTALYRHIQTHTKENLSACAFCKKRFAQESNANRHQLICKFNPKQSDEEWVRKQKQFKCKLCDYSSTQNRCLKRHMVSHIGKN